MQQYPKISFCFLKIALVFMALLVPKVSGASSEQLPTMPERFERFSAMLEMKTLFSGGVANPNWMKDGFSFWYATPHTGGTRFFLVDAKAQTKTPFFDEQKLRTALAEISEMVLPESGLPFSNFQLMDDEKQSQFKIAGKSYELNLENYHLELLPENSEETPAPTPGSLTSPDGSKTVFTKEKDLWIDSTRLTEDGTDNLIWTTYGASWSPDSKYLLLQQYNLENVATIPVIDWLDPATPSERSPYPFSIGPGIANTLFVLRDNQIVHIPANIEPDDDFNFVGWDANSNSFLVLRTNSTTTRLDLLAIDPSNEKIEILISEQHDTFLGGPACVFRMDDFFTLLDDEKHFIWMSDRDGYYHFYLYKLDGTLVNQITSGQYADLRIAEVDLENDWVYYIARSGADDPYHQHVFRTKLSGKKVTRLTTGTGRHKPKFNPDRTYFVDNFSAADEEPTAVLRSSNGKKSMSLEKADISRLIAAGWQPPKRATVKAADGKTDIHAALYLPPGFDPELSYPIIEMIYAGPQWTIIPSVFHALEYGEIASALSQLGYVSVIIDGRGTPGRGRAFHDHAHQNVGITEISDHSAALQNLAATRPWMDLDRVGVHGKSWGGYFTLRAMLQAPEIYKVGVASSLVADLSTTMSTPVVPYNGLPSENPDGYAEGNCLTQAEKLQGQLLMTIGTADMNTPFSQTMQMLNAFTEAGKDVDILVFPGQNHWLDKPNFQRWQRELRDYFLEHLPPEALKR